MRRIFFFLPIIAVFLFSCSENDKWRLERSNIRSVSMPDTVYSNQPFPITINCWYGNSCYEFSHVDYREDGYNIYVDALSRFPEEARACPLVIVEYSYTGQYSISAAGTYIFHFSQYGPTLLDTVVVK